MWQQKSSFIQYIFPICHILRYICDSKDKNKVQIDTIRNYV